MKIASGSSLLSAILLGTGAQVFGAAKPVFSDIGPDAAAYGAPGSIGCAPRDDYRTNTGLL